MKLCTAQVLVHSAYWLASYADVIITRWHCRQQVYEKQVQHLQKQLHAAEEEHRCMTARLEASVKTASVKEAEAAAAGKAEQAAVQAAEHARQQSCAAVAAATGVQPHLSSPRFQPFTQHQRPMRMPEQQVRQEFEGQKLLNSAMGPLTSHRHGLVVDSNGGHSASRAAVRPSRDCSPSTYASRMRDMQDHIEALTRSLSQNRQSSPKRQRGKKGGRHGIKDKHQADEQKKRRPQRSPVQLASKRLDTLDLFDSEDALSSSGRSHDDEASESTSDRSAPASLQHVRIQLRMLAINL